MGRESRKVFWAEMSVLFLVLLAVHLFVPIDYGDDVFFAQAYGQGDLPGFLKGRYREWTSRIVLEAAVIPLAANPMLWKILNIFMVLLLVWITADLFGWNNRKLQAQAFFSVIMWIVPMGSLYSSGCITVTTHYLWVLTLGLVAMRPLKHWLLGEKCARWERVVCPLCILYAADMEQMAAILLGVYLAAGLYLMTSGDKCRQPSLFYFLLLLLIMGMVVFILTAPGNACRKISETESYFPEFAGLNFGEKLLMGFIENTHYYIAAGHGQINYVFPLLAGILLAEVLKQDRLFWIKLTAAAVPFCFYWGIGQLGNLLLTKGVLARGYVIYLLGRNRQLPGLGEFSGEMVAFQTAVYLLVLACVALTILFLHGRTKETLLQLLILGAGFFSRLIMGFSPTIYASGDRTALFCSASVLLVAMRNLQIYWSRTEKWYGRAVIGIYTAAILAANLL